MKNLHTKFQYQYNKYLLSMEALQVDLRNLTSLSEANGKIHIPTYCDNRLICSHVEARKFARNAHLEIVKKIFPQVDLFAGIATAGIGGAAVLGDHLDRPYVYVRTEAKPYGKKKQVEGGLIRKGDKVVVVEDLIFQGVASLQVVELLRQMGADVIGILALCSYDLKVVNELFRQANIPCYSLTTFPSLIEDAEKAAYISQEQKDELMKWHADPQSWQMPL